MSGLPWPKHGRIHSRNDVAVFQRCGFIEVGTRRGRILLTVEEVEEMLVAIAKVIPPDLYDEPTRPEIDWGLYTYGSEPVEFHAIAVAAKDGQPPHLWMTISDPFGPVVAPEADLPAEHAYRVLVELLDAATAAADYRYATTAAMEVDLEEQWWEAQS